MKINLKLTSLFVVSAVANMASVVLVVRPVDASTDTDLAPASFDIAVNDGAVSVATASSSPDVEEETSTTMTTMSMSSFFSSAKNLIFGSDRNAAAVAADDTIPTFPVQVDVESIIEDGEDQDDVDNDLDDELDDGEYWVWTNSSSVPDSIDGGMTVFDVDNDTNLMHGRFRLIVGGIEAKRFSGKDISIFDMVFRETYNTIHGVHDGIYLVNQRDEKIEVAADNDDDDDEDDGPSDKYNAVGFDGDEDDENNESGSLRGNRNSLSSSNNNNKSRFSVDALGDFRCRGCDSEDDDRTQFIKDPKTIAKLFCQNLRKTNIRKFLSSRKCRLLLRKKTYLTNDVGAGAIEGNNEGETKNIMVPEPPSSSSSSSSVVMTN